MQGIIRLYFGGRVRAAIGHDKLTLNRMYGYFRLSQILFLSIHNQAPRRQGLNSRTTAMEYAERRITIIR